MNRWLFIGLLLLASFSVEAMDQGQAYVSCRSRPQFNAGNSTKQCVDLGKNATTGVCRVGLLATNGGYIIFDEYDCSSTCGARVGMQNVRFTGNAGSCSNGCAFSVDSDGTWESVTVGGVTVTKASKMLPTGQLCSVGDATNTSDPLGDEDKCVQDGTLTQCVRADGKHCATASTGKQFCWSPGESGVKTAANGNEAATKSPVNTQINAPKDPPKNGGDWTVTGQSQVTTSSSSGSTTTDNVTTFNSSYGNQGSGTGDGTGSGSDGGNGSGSGDDGDGGSQVGGDGECQGSFTCTGGDPALCAIALQTYKARCDAASRFDGETGAFPGNGDGGAGDDPDPKDSHKTASPGLGWLDDSGFTGGGQCPQLPTVSTSWGDFSMDQENFCDLIQVARACLILLGAFVALGILMGWGQS